MSAKTAAPTYLYRLWLLGFLLGCLLLAVLARTLYLHVWHDDFLLAQGQARAIRTLPVAAHRGLITDRNGEALAVSTPVQSVWVNPQEIPMQPDLLTDLASLLGVSPRSVLARLQSYADKEFVYLQRHLSPSEARQISDRKIPGVHLQTEYRRYYPAGEVAAHVVGFTNIDDAGQEGIELAFEQQLEGIAGRKRVLKDRKGRHIRDLALLQPPQPGQDLALSLDKRLQYLAYRELKAAVQLHRARAGSLVMVDVQTGEILAMVNQPAYNPNNRAERNGERFRNRALTDVFEPGSTMKPFTVAAALESGQFQPHTAIDTSPGWLRLNGYTIRDLRNYGRIDIATIVQKSSNVGTSKLALALEPEQLWDMYSRMGLGVPTSTGFPGERGGYLQHRIQWKPIELATFSYGYGMSVTLGQLAQAYATLGAYGEMHPLTLLKTDEPIAEPQLSPNVARQVLQMLEQAVIEGGTGTRAQVDGYRVGGKSGTVRKAAAGGYADNEYIALFAGVGPISQPRFALAIAIHEPKGEDYYGGLVAAPVFSEVMASAFRLYHVQPDAAPAPQTLNIAGQLEGQES